MAKSKDPKELAGENTESQNMIFIYKLANTCTVMDNKTDSDKVNTEAGERYNGKEHQVVSRGGIIDDHQQKGRKCRRSGDKLV